ncbi:MAG: hypothetical protein WA919_19540 [Coleofasciculaceae cyanobacterium]
MNTISNQPIHLTTTNSEETITLVSSNSTDSPSSSYQTLLVNGGVTILAILALAYFSKTLIESIAKLLELWEK